MIKILLFNASRRNVVIFKCRMNYAVVFKTISTVLWEYAVSQTSHFPFEVCLKKYEILVDYEHQYYSQLKS